VNSLLFDGLAERFEPQVAVDSVYAIRTPPLASRWNCRTRFVTLPASRPKRVVKQDVFPVEL
jgi:hypothetical protein